MTTTTPTLPELTDLDLALVVSGLARVASILHAEAEPRAARYVLDLAKAVGGEQERRRGLFDALTLSMRPDDFGEESAPDA